MKIACLYFTASGKNIAEYLERSLEESVTLFSKENYRRSLASIFAEYRAIVFISAVGIAVRCSAPHLKDKTKDPAVVVVDDMGRFAVSLLSGHVGGANRLTERVAKLLDAQPVVTTASDSRGFEAVDLFAQKYGLEIESMASAKKLTALMVDNQPIRLIAPAQYRLNYAFRSDRSAKGAIVVSAEIRPNVPEPTCLLRPKVFHVGIGCRRGKSKKAILDAIELVFEKNGLAQKSIKTLSSITLKANEAGLLEAARELGAEMRFFGKKEIQGVQALFPRSSFVESVTETASVCEPCAYLNGGELVVPKHAIGGVTVAVAREA